MQEFADIHALAAVQGSHLGHSPWHTVTQEQVNQFADATGDHQWIHVDAERAAAGPFGGTIAHGFLSLSLLPMFSWQTYRLRKAPAMSINYGLNKVRFLQPVRVGSRVRDSLELAEVKETPKGLLLTMRHEVEIDGEERPALVAEALSLVVP
ncbi:MaoC family dehydratase [Thermobifida alba]|uniref:MaoC family dehydratase n=1 Tax=Thermobifida alba TaxID=53522 RepID=A0ABY4KX76_THEAE|nr:MaoC family dehydratase [Thermobifida alba]UPT19814.1 MaoC family dehydratase [Thermobifida alba]HLU97216.1 MaoC family dehydratase [Thermobifida alba]